MGLAPDVDCIRRIIDAATRAPSVHNSQPWLWEYDIQRLHLIPDWSRQLRYGDPDGRDLLISCGAALHHACVAAAAWGWGTTVRRLPQRPDDRLLASVAFHPLEPNLVHSAALTAIRERRTDRRTPSSQEIPGGQLDAMVRAAVLHGAFATVLPDEASDQLRDLMLLSSVVQNSSDEYLQELAAWTHSQGDDGVPDSSMLFLPGRDLPRGAKTRFPSGRLLETEPGPDRPRQTWLLLTTSSDDTVSRIRAGEALSAILIMARLQGLAAVPYTQPIEVDTTRTGLEHALLRGSSHLQVILRVAVPAPDQSSVRRTRRRPVDTVLRIAEPSISASTRSDVQAAAAKGGRPAPAG